MELVLGKVYDQLKTTLGEEYTLIRNAPNELEKLKRLRAVISNVQLDVASQDLSQQQALNDWLDEMKDAAYDAEDIIDMFNAEILRRTSNINTRFICRVIDFFSCINNPLIFRHQIGTSVQKTFDRLSIIAKERGYHLTLCARDGGMGNHSMIRQTLSDLGKDVIFGRDQDLEDIVERLIHPKTDMEVIVLVGMGGVGKTTLAKLVYHNSRVNDLFADRKVWVCVSTKNYDLMKIVKDVIGQLQIKQKQKKINGDCEIDISKEMTLEALNLILNDIFNQNKKFLLVLDDVWNDIHFDEKWRQMESFFQHCKILVTTREENITSTMSQFYLHHVGCLSEEACWSLFEKMAFPNSAIPNNLKEIGLRILKKCERLPLAVRVLGNLMKTKQEEADWLRVENSNIWDIHGASKSVLLVLKLSYNHLSLESQHCFAYCSVFPKDSVLNKLDLIQQWSGNGFIFHNETKEMEHIGNEIFENLLSRCFFQDVEKDVFGNITTFKMHDLIHDLAQSIAKRHCRILINNNQDDSLSDRKNIRFLSIDMREQVSYSDIPMKWKDIHVLRTLHSFSPQIMNKSFLVDCFTKLKFLRVLNCSEANVVDVPSSIDNLKLLRYVDFSRTKIKQLPKTICRLHNLQTLKVNFCRDLVVLPKELGKLSKLRHLENKGCLCLHAMPIRMGQLSFLQTLNSFVVSINGGTLNELLQLNQLGGGLLIYNLDRIRNVDMENGILSSKENLVSLDLEWEWVGSQEMDLERDDEKVLKTLEPHPNLKFLSISNFGSICLPAWMSASSQHLVDVSLFNCSKCVSLPSFGHLPYLRILNISSFKSVEKIDETFYGLSGTSNFRSLEELNLEEMPLFREMSSVQGREIFPKLSTLKINNCPNLKAMPEIRTLCSLVLKSCDNALLLWLVVNSPSISKLEIFNISNLTCITDNYFENLTTLRELIVTDCWELVSFSDTAMKHISSLEKMHIVDCSKLTSLPNSMSCLNSLTVLKIIYCEMLTSLPNSMGGLKSLTYLSIRSCRELNDVSLVLECLPSLQRIEIVKCHGIRNWSDGAISRICSVEGNSVIGICSKDDDILLSRWLQKKIDSTKILHTLRINGSHKFEGYESSYFLPGQHILSVCCFKLEHLPDELVHVRDLQHLHILDCPNLSCLPKDMKEPGHLVMSGCPILKGIDQGFHPM